MENFQNKPRLLFLTRTKPESIFLSRRLKLLKNVELLGTIIESNHEGKLKLILKKIKKYFKNKKFIELIYLSHNLV